MLTLAGPYKVRGGSVGSDIWAGAGSPASSE